VVVILVAAIPALFAWVTAPNGSTYLGYQYNSDDHMVYAAWIRQAMDGRFFFDNRFTTDRQPGLTVHIYFFLLGLIAKVTGISVATTLARLGFSALFVFLIHRLVKRLNWTFYATKLAVSLTIVGGGIGFLTWQSFGQDFVLPSPITGILMGHLPVDVWQPEGFIFPSMLTNSLFMVSLCLILYTLDAYLECRRNPKVIIPGAVAIGLLMNIHSYDALLIGLVLIGFVAASAVQNALSKQWLGRSALISLGLIPAALWFFYVLKNDPVFQFRAATETYAPNFRQIVFGYLPLVILAFAGVINRIQESEDTKARKRRTLGVALLAATYVLLFVLASGHVKGYFLTGPAFGAVFLATIGAVALASEENMAWNLFFAWASIGLIAVYFPGLFQRKLAMGLSIPWAVLAAYGLHGVLKSQDRSSRNLVLALSIIVLGASSVRWFAREILFIRTNVSNTTRHPVYLTADVEKIIDYLNHQPGKKVLLALPGVASSSVAEGNNGTPIPDSFQTPSIPDLAPIVTGLTGTYSYAGHWSETPEYTKRVGDLYPFFFREPYGAIHRVMAPEDRRAFIARVGATYAIVAAPASYPSLPLVAPEDLGAVVVHGSQFELVKL
jgi:hypothetical protein